MYISKKVKTFLFTISLSLLIASPVYAGTYTVTSGDSLFSIGKLFNSAVSVIKQDNNLSSNTIYPGQALKVQSKTYMVKSGDSLYNIAVKFGVSLDTLRKANNLWSNSIYPGQILNIPGAAWTSGSSSSGAVIPYSTSDLDLLARLITAEADGQPYQAKVGVGAVIVNRVKSGQFPNTIPGVIYQVIDGFYQFTPVENGWIYRPATQDAKDAAYAALHGNDPTRGALFYFDDSATNTWLWSKPIALRVDKMVFTY